MSSSPPTHTIHPKRLSYPTNPLSFPDPIIYTPATTHSHSLILLHGRGDNAENFAALLTLMQIPAYANRTLLECLPTTKFILPTATLTHASRFAEMRLRQWFDCWSYFEQEEREELQVEGLRATVGHVHGLIRREVELVGAGNVVLGGLSQGCAASLISLLSWEGEPFAGVVGMCGWLPFRKFAEESFGRKLYGEDKEFDEGNAELENDKHAEDEEGPVPTNILVAKSKQGLSSGKVLGSSLGSKVDAAQPKRESAVGPLSTADSQAGAIKDLIDMLDLKGQPSMLFRQVPVFLGHGANDETVPAQRTPEASRVLNKLGTESTYKLYPDLMHWYSPAMLGDVVDFLMTKLPEGAVVVGEPGHVSSARADERCKHHQWAVECKICESSKVFEDSENDI